MSIAHLAFEFDLDQLLGDDLLRMQRGKSANKVFQLANIAGPAVPLHPIERRLLDIFLRQAFADGDLEEMMHEIGNVLAALAQRRQAQRHDVQPEIQILAEQSLLNERAQSPCWWRR